MSPDWNSSNWIEVEQKFRNRTHKTEGSGTPLTCF
jgi:hypothetical protein